MEANTYVDITNNIIGSFNDWKLYKNKNNTYLIDTAEVVGGKIIIETYYHGIIHPFKTVCTCYTDEPAFKDYKGKICDCLSLSEATQKHADVISEIININNALGV